MREIELVGLYPATLSPCTVCRIGELSEKLSIEQSKEAPPSAVADADRAALIADAVLARHGDTVRIRITPIDSPRGMWLSLRHRLGGGMQAIVDGRRRVPAEADAILAALA